MMDVSAIRSAVRAAIEQSGFSLAAYDIIDVRSYDVIPADAQLPCAFVRWPERVLYHQTISDSTEIGLVVTVAVERNDFESAQRQIDRVMSWPEGLGNAIEQYAPQDNAYRQAVAVSAGNVRAYESPACLACDLNITVYTF